MIATIPPAATLVSLGVLICSAFDDIKLSIPGAHAFRTQQAGPCSAKSHAAFHAN